MALCPPKLSTSRAVHTCSPAESIGIGMESLVLVPGPNTGPAADPGAGPPLASLCCSHFHSVTCPTFTPGMLSILLSSQLTPPRTALTPRPMTPSTPFQALLPNCLIPFQTASNAFLTLFHWLAQVWRKDSMPRVKNPEMAPQMLCPVLRMPRQMLPKRLLTRLQMIRQPSRKLLSRAVNQLAMPFQMLVKNRRMPRQMLEKRLLTAFQMRRHPLRNTLRAVVNQLAMPFQMLAKKRRMPCQMPEKRLRMLRQRFCQNCTNAFSAAENQRRIALQMLVMTWRILPIRFDVMSRMAAKSPRNSALMMLNTATK